MKNRVISHVHEQARIYRHHYKPSLNVLRLIRSVLSVFISGQSLVANKYNHHRK
jgi:hypothetical protein